MRGFTSILAILLMGCVGNGVSGEDTSTDTQGDTVDAIEDTATDQEQDDVESEGECTHIECFADYPCIRSSVCRGDSIVSCRSISCEVTCGTPCCMGGTCGGEGGIISTCDPDEQCMERPSGAVRTECRPVAADASTDGDDDGWYVPDGSTHCI